MSLTPCALIAATLANGLALQSELDDNIIATTVVIYGRTLLF